MSLFDDDLKALLKEHAEHGTDPAEIHGAFMAIVAECTVAGGYDVDATVEAIREACQFRRQQRSLLT